MNIKHQVNWVSDLKPNVTLTRMLLDVSVTSKWADLATIINKIVLTIHSQS